jgi:hypothetical protein
MMVCIASGKNCIDTSTSLALEYERAYKNPTMQTFFDNSLPFLRHPEVQSWGDDLMAEREALQQNNADSI